MTTTFVIDVPDVTAELRNQLALDLGHALVRQGYRVGYPDIPNNHTTRLLATGIGYGSEATIRIRGNIYVLRGGRTSVATGAIEQWETWGIFLSFSSARRVLSDFWSKKYVGLVACIFEVPEGMYIAKCEWWYRMVDEEVTVTVRPDWEGNPLL